MFNKEFLKTLTIMYVEDDNSIRESLGSILNKVFKKVVLCVDGQDGLSKFTQCTNDSNVHIDAIVSDINMPKMNGLEMLAKIREIDTEVPAILTTAHGESDFLMEAIKVNVSYYALKPINTPLLLENIQKFCMLKHQQNLIIRKEKELSSYIDIIDQVATITKIDKAGNFIDVNDLFCEVSLYDKENIIGKHITDVTHKDILSSIYTSMQETIQKGEDWEGLYKSIDNENNTFFLRISAIPDFDDTTQEMQGCTFIGFIATDDEQEKRDTMQKVRQNIIEQRKKASQLQNQIKHLESTNSKPVPAKPASNLDISFMRDSLESTKTKNVKLLNQLKHYEKDLSALEYKLSHIVETELTKRQDLMDRNKSLQVENESLKEKFIHVQNQLTRVENKLSKDKK